MRKSKVIFIKNALILTITGIIIRFIGMFFRVWLAGKIGAEGIGLYSQVFSFYVLASAFASTGINTAVTRMVSEELAVGNGRAVKTILSRCMAVSLTIALISCAIIFFGADFIAEKIVDDPRAADALRTLTLSLPFMGFSSCLKGYFIARKKTAPASSSQIFEQLARIGFIAFIIGKEAGKGLTAACRGVIFGDCIAEICSFIFIYVSYLIDKKQYIVHKEGSKPQYSVLSKLRHIALPITVGRYLNSLLRTAENVLVPRQLEKFGMSGERSLALFGVVKGMALPLIFFPASFLNALSTLLIPEMSEASASGRHYKVKYTAQKCIHITLITSLPMAVIFFYTAPMLGRVVYGDSDSGEIIRMLSPIIPVMYMDSVCDGLLKGLDEQLSIFRNAMIDSISRLGLIILFLPKFGIAGFVGIMYLSNFFTCSMNLTRLIRISKAEVKWFKWFVLPALCALCLGTTFDLIVRSLNFSDIPYIICVALPSSVAYLIAVTRLNCISVYDLR